MKRGKTDGREISDIGGEKKLLNCSGRPYLGQVLTHPRSSATETVSRFSVNSRRVPTSYAFYTRWTC